MANTKKAGRKSDSIDLGRLRNEAEKGSGRACTTIGSFYSRGVGVSKDAAEAEKYFKQAMSLGDSLAEFYLARLYIDESRAKEALPLFRASATRDHIPSIYWLGALYMRGVGVEKNLQEAEKYLVLAAQKGHMYARRDCYRALISGAFGKRNVIKGVFGILVSIFPYTKLLLSNPNSDLLH